MTHGDFLGSYPTQKKKQIFKIFLKKSDFPSLCPGASSLYMLTNPQPLGVIYIGEAFCGIIN